MFLNFEKYLKFTLGILDFAEGLCNECGNKFESQNCTMMLKHSIIDLNHIGTSERKNPKKNQKKYLISEASVCRAAPGFVPSSIK